MPIKYTPAMRKQILQRFIAYIEQNEHPILSEFAYLNNIPEGTLYAWGNQEPNGRYKGDVTINDFPQAYKKMLAKSKTYLIKKPDEKGINPAHYIFQLKACHGLKDQESQPATTNVNVNIDKVLNAEPEKLESGVQSLLQSTKIDNSRKRKSSSQKN